MSDKLYKMYLDNHNDPKVRLMHFIGQLATILYGAWTVSLLMTWPYSLMCWLLFLLTPLIVYPFAISGHVLFGKNGNRPSFYKMSLLQSKRCDLKMFIDILKGKLSIW